MLHVELRHRHVRTRISVERDEAVQGPIADDDARGVGGAVARKAFELGRQIEQALHVRVRLHLRRQFAHAVQGALQVPRVGRMVGHQFGEPVDMTIAHLQHAARVLEHRARLQPPESDDLRYLVAPVFFLDVADHAVALGFAEVDIEVGHRHALGVEEAFKQQVEF